jgi:hypothetical protein
MCTWKLTTYQYSCGDVEVDLTSTSCEFCPEMAECIEKRKDYIVTQQGPRPGVDLCEGVDAPQVTVRSVSDTCNSLNCPKDGTWQ